MKIALIEKFLDRTPALDVGTFDTDVQATISPPALMPIAGTKQAFASVYETLTKNYGAVCSEIDRLTQLRDELTVALEAIRAGQGVIQQHKDAQHAFDNNIADLMTEAQKLD